MAKRDRENVVPRSGAPEELHQAPTDSADGKVSSNGGNGDDGPVVKAPPKNPRQRFEANAERRVSKLLKALGAVERMADKRSWEMTEEEREYMLSAIDAAYRQMTNAYKGEKVKAAGFRFANRPVS